MSDDLNIEGHIDLDIAKALKAIDRLVDGIAELRESSPHLEKALSGIEKQATAVAVALNQGTSSVTKQAKAVETLTSQYQKLGMTSLKGADRVTKELQSTLKLQQDLAKQSQSKAFDSYKPNIEATKAIEKQYAQQVAYAQQANEQMVRNSSKARQQELSQLRNAIIERNRLQEQSSKAQISYAAQATRAGKTYGQALLTENTALANQRYALYDVASSFAAVSLATLGAATAAVAVGISYEKAFAAVERTSQASGQQLANLRDELISLSMQVPLSFEQISEIAALGGQLGIAASGLDDFTEVVAKLVATTNLSADAAGTALGRFDALFEEIDPTKFNALGSAILKVGVNSVATETQIVNTATQISSMGDFAGLTAEQVVGLSGALASVGAQPELARGTVTRVFTQMSTAISAGGDSLDEFARLAGVSAAEFKSAWGTERFAAIFQKFLVGIERDGQGAIATLNDLGISSVRDVPLLLRLAGAQEVVRNAFDDSKKGYAEATELNDQYKITLKTVAAQLTIFGNTLKAMLDNVGGAALGPLSGVIGLFQNLAESLVALGGTGVGKVVGVVVLALTGLVGVLTGLRALQALSIATTYALATAHQALGAEGLKAAGSMGGLVKSMAAVTLGTTRATAATTAYNVAIQQGQSKIVAYAAGFKGATSAVNGFAGAGRTALAAFGWMAAIGVGISLLTNFANSEAEARAKVEELTASLDQQTGAFTENTTEIVYNMLFKDGSVKKATELGISMNTLKAAALGNKDAIAQLQAGYERWNMVASEPVNYDQSFDENVEKQADRVQDASEKADAYSDILKSVGITSQAASDAQADLQTKTDFTGQTMDDAGSSAQDMVNNLQDLLDVQYDLVGGTVAVQNAIYALGASLGENGNDFSAYSVAGRENLAALQQALSSMVQASGGDAQALAVMVAGLMQTLAAQGVDTVNQLGFVQNALAQLTGGKGVGGLPGVGEAAKQAANALGQGFSSGAGKAAKAARSAGRGSKEAAKEIKTLTDYVSDLAGVFKTAFEIRFGLEQSLDAVAEGWQKMADSAEDAQESIRDATQELIEADATIGSLKAANNTLEYQLTVAQQYGDVLRATEILAEIAENNADITDEQKKRIKTEKELAKAQAAAIPSLDGQTEGSREQRDMVLGLVKSYQEQVAALANSGLSQQEVARRTQELKNQFIAQLTQMGYNRAEIERYAASFDDLTAAILRVPRNITVNADTSPAQRAIDEFMAKNENRAVGVGLSTPGGGTTYGQGYDAGEAYRQGWELAMSKRRTLTRVDASVPGGKAYSTDGGANWFFSKGGSVPQYRASGGGMGHPGGPKGTDTIPAWLTPGEFVMQRSAVQSMGLPFMNAVNNQQVPKYLATGGSSSGSSSAGVPRIQLVELLPNQLQMLATMLSSELSIDGRIVAEATNQSNAVSARRGTN